MGDVERRRAAPTQDGAHVGGQLLAQGPVQGGQGLVQQQQPRRRGERPGQGHPLGLPAGQGRHAPPLEAGQADELKHLAHPLAPLGARQAGETVGDIAADVAVLEELAVLEHEAEAALVDGHAHHAPPVPGDLAGGHVLQAGHRAQQGGLARARGPQEGDDLPGGHLQVDAVDGVQVPVGHGEPAHG